MKKQMTKAEIVKQHNYNSGYEPMQMSEYESFDKMPAHIKESYRSEYDIVDDIVPIQPMRQTQMVCHELRDAMDQIIAKYPNLTLNGYLDVREKFDPSKANSDVEVVLKGFHR